MFEHQTISIKNSGAACRAIKYAVVSKKESFKLARAIIERRDPFRVTEILGFDQIGKVDLSWVWRRRAMDVILEVGEWNNYMDCLAVLPTSEMYIAVRKELLERLVKESYEKWKPMKLGTEYDCNLTQFWSQKFSPSEVRTITQKVIESDSREFAESWVHLSAKYSPQASLTQTEHEALCVIVHSGAKR